MTICSHGCDNSTCKDCHISSFAISPGGTLLNDRQPTGCVQGCQEIPVEYPGIEWGTNTGREPWDEIRVEGDMAWLSSRGFKMASGDQALELVSLTRCLIGDACGKPLRARATALLGKYVQGWQFDLVLAAAHKQRVSINQFVIDAVLEEKGRIGDERDMCMAVNAAHSVGTTLGCFLAERTLIAANKVIHLTPGNKDQEE